MPELYGWYMVPPSIRSAVDRRPVKHALYYERNAFEDEGLSGMEASGVQRAVARKHRSWEANPDAALAAGNNRN